MQPLSNPAGFGVGDSLLFALAAILCLLIAAAVWLESPLRRWADKKVLWFGLFAVLPVILRVALLPHHPVPTPNTADDFSYLLLGDTLAHFRLANATHPMHRFFETVFVLQEPTYSSIFPMGQGIVLAAGELVFREPWAGVLLSMGILCGSIYWMLRGWVAPFWAFIGGLLAVCEFGPLSSWMNSYWGGAVSGIAGCLVFGALPRLGRTSSKRDAAILGAGLAIQILTRPFEAVLLILCVALYFAPGLFQPDPKKMVRQAAVALVFIVVALLAVLIQNHAVTGSWTTLPYQASQVQYGVPASFVFQPNPEPHRDLTREQELDYHAQRAVHGAEQETMRSFVDRLGYRLRYYRFFFYAPLLIALAAFPWALREPRYGWALLWVLIFALGTNLYPYFYPHYIAALTCVFVLIAVVALERLSQWKIGGIPAGREMARMILFLCVAQFAFWYSLHLFYEVRLLASLGRYETWDYINYGDLDGRIAVNQRLALEPGKHLVFVRYSPTHLFDEWIHNLADIDGSKVVFAADRDQDNLTLRKYFSGRAAWILEPDARPPLLYRYPAQETVTIPSPQPQPTPQKGRVIHIDPKLFETVH